MSNIDFKNWVEFEKTGKIDAYLKYKEEEKEEEKRGDSFVSCGSNRNSDTRG